MIPTLTVGFVLALACSAFDDDVIKIDQLPPAVRKTVDAHIHGAPITEIERQREGKRFEISFTVDKRYHRIAVDDQGKIVEYKDELPLDMVPAPARQAIQKDAAGLELVGVWQYVRGKLVFYKSTVMRNGKKASFIAEPDGLAYAEGSRPTPGWTK
jgi:hypothetical protein